jgi:hypothetical protein
MRVRDILFSSWPEMTRASILATATKGVDWIDNSHRTTKLGLGVSDLRQGAGQLNALRAVDIADPQYYVPPNGPAKQTGRFAKFYDFAADFTDGWLSNDTYAITATFTGRLRATMAWDASPTGCLTTNGAGCLGETLDGDLDLRLDKWNGTDWVPACRSSSYDSSWELCDVAVTSGETYRIQFAKYATAATGTYLGVAWYMYDPATD